MLKREIMLALREPGVIAILRAKGPRGLSEAVQALYAGGLKSVEISLTTPGALDVVSDVRKACPAGCVIGVGTVLDADTVRRSLGRGAQFVVSPIFSEGMLEACQEADAPILCGAYTPTEAYHAYRLGADMIKLFPANGLGPGYVKALLAPLPMLSLVPTGGVTAENCGEYIRSGAAAVAVGTSVVRDQWIEQAQWDKMSSRAAEYVQAVARARKEM